jgi:hypothetical protein
MLASFEPGSSGQCSFGKFCYKQGTWQINNEGWNNTYNYINNNKPTIAIIGDSYIEAFQVDVGKSLGPLVHKKISSLFNVYSFGTSGAPLSQYLQIARYVNRKFQPKIIALNLIHNDFNESISAEQYSKVYLRYRKMNDSVFIEDTIEKFHKPSPLSTLIKKFAFGRYLIHNLKIQEMHWYSIFKNTNDSDTAQFNANIDVQKVKSQQNDIRIVTEQILLQFKKEFPTARLILLIDGLRKEIYQNIPYEQSNIVWMNTMVKELAQKHSIELVDLTHAFALDYSKNKTHFESTYDWHWNEYGHQIVAYALYKQILSKTK